MTKLCRAHSSLFLIKPLAFPCDPFFCSSEDFQQQIIAHKLYQYFQLIRNRTKWTECKEKNAMTSIRFHKSDTFCKIDQMNDTEMHMSDTFMGDRSPCQWYRISLNMISFVVFGVIVSAIEKDIIII